MNKIAIAGKGGGGKTTTVTNLGVIAHRAGLRSVSSTPIRRGRCGIGAMRAQAPTSRCRPAVPAG
jgi:Pyruvate/2-oxoacid:ferredoxin oxidoreductase gamma subunit